MCIEALKAIIFDQIVGKARAFIHLIILHEVASTNNQQ